MGYGNTKEILKRCRKQKAALWPAIENLRPELLEIAREIYPSAVIGLSDEPEQFRARQKDLLESDQHRLTIIAMDAFRLGASGFHVNLTSPARKWFSLTIPEFGGGEEGSEALQAIERLTAGTRWLVKWSGGYHSLSKIYQHLLAFGFGCIIAQPDEERILRTECLRMGTYALGVDRKGKPDRLIRKFAYTADQLLEEFGKDVLAPNVLKAAAAGEQKSYAVWNLIEPHKELVTGPEDAAWTLPYDKFSYRSVYWMDGQNGAPLKGLLSVRGFVRKPFVAARMEFEAGDVYGRGRGALALGMCRGLQQLCEDRLDISGMAAQPAVVVSADLEGDLQLGRGGVNYAPAGEQHTEIVRRALSEPPHASDISDEMVRLTAEIKSIFFNDEFASITQIKEQSGVKTATEIGQLIRENMEQLSALATILDDELLDPIVTLYLNYALDAKVVQLPDQLDGMPLNVKYESNIHRAQAAADINARNSSFSFVMQVANANPEVLDNIDFDRAVREMHRAVGGEEQDLVDTKIVEERREKRKEQAEKQARLEQAAQQASTLKELASAPVTDQSLGGKLVGAMAGNEQPY